MSDDCGQTGYPASNPAAFSNTDSHIAQTSLKVTAEQIGHDSVWCDALRLMNCNGITYDQGKLSVSVETMVALDSGQFYPRFSRGRVIS